MEIFIAQEKKGTKCHFTSPKVRGSQQYFLMDTQKGEIAFSEQQNPSISVQVFSDEPSLTNFITSSLCNLSFTEFLKRV